ncbi:hypothetical protein AURDEDRAFT_183735 [Auricularia subglabra TFB-10046 SS5]|nr:hypothetical protein AURDEDRAFT_183735 [Auricularia subglabra TFB-10046 SS5]
MDSVLHQVADAPVLTHELAAQWLVRVDDDIRAIKARIHDQVTRNRATFDRQHSTAKSVKARLASLTKDIDALYAAVDDPKEGLAVTLTNTLQENKTVQQDALDALTFSQASQHLLTCARDLHAVSDHTREGRLRDAAAACTSLSETIASSPMSLAGSKVLKEMKARLSTLQHKVQEQLGVALAQCVQSQSSKQTLTIRDFTTPANASAHITLHDICTSIQRESLLSHLNTLRKDLAARLLEPILLSSAVASVQSTAELHILSLTSAAGPSKHLESLTTILRFLHDNLFPHLPTQVASDYAASLYTPFASAVLQQTLVQHLPHTLAHLPAFLKYVRDAIAFESAIASDFRVTNGRECLLAEWADKLPSYYEKQRRLQLLEEARGVFLAPGKDESVRVDAPRGADATNGHSSGEGSFEAVPEPEPEKEKAADEFENSWDFDDDGADNPPAGGRKSTDSWGFDDDEEEVEVAIAPAPTPAPAPALSVKPPDISVSPSEDDSSSNGWGWDDDDDGDAAPIQTDTQTETVDDDPWESAWADPAPPPKPPASAPPQTAGFAQPKAASRLEKKLAKSRGGALGVPTTPLSANPVAHPHKSFASSQHQGFNSQPVSAQAPPTPPVPTRTVRKAPEKETFFVSRSAITALDVAKRALSEGKELAASPIFDEQTPTRGGSALSQASSSVLDLFRALAPVKETPPFGGSSSLALRYSNDCQHLSHAARQLAADTEEARCKDLLEDTSGRLQECSTHWFEDTLDRRRDALLDVLSAAEGFVEVGDAEQFLQCKTIVEQLAKDITKLAKEWKPILTKRAHYTAIGTLVDSVLAQMLEQILSLDDIPDVESRHLSQLCHLLTPLEDLFVDEPEGSSLVVVHVPSWLKFSYLSELLEASLTDISYLYDEGALIDFETEELTKLIRALFADTPMRANAIAKINGGH